MMLGAARLGCLQAPATQRASARAARGAAQPREWARRRPQRRRHQAAPRAAHRREGQQHELFVGLSSLLDEEPDHRREGQQHELFVGLSSLPGEEPDSPAAATTMPSTQAAAAALAGAALLLLAAPLPAEALSLSDAVGGLEDLVQGAGAAGPLVFIAAYVVCTVLLVPGSVLTLAAGFLFGPALGTAVVSVAATAGASAAFLVGRYAARPAVERRIAGNARWAAVDAAIGRQGAKIVFLARLSPLLPFTFLNYALSLTNIEFGPYVLASWAGMLPGTVAYVALGGAGKAAAETAAGAGAGPLQLALYALGAAATLGAAALVSRAAARALEEAGAGEGGSGEGGGSDEPLRRRDSSE